jgi:predicted amidophosphoribosyltransferase
MRLACPECHEDIGRVKNGHDARCPRCRRALEHDAIQHGVRRTLTRTIK